MPAHQRIALLLIFPVLGGVHGGGGGGGGGEGRREGEGEKTPPFPHPPVSTAAVSLCF